MPVVQYLDLRCRGPLRLLETRIIETEVEPYALEIDVALPPAVGVAQRELVVDRQRRVVAVRDLRRREAVRQQPRRLESHAREHVLRREASERGLIRRCQRQRMVACEARRIELGITHDEIAEVPVVGIYRMVHAQHHAPRRYEVARRTALHIGEGYARRELVYTVRVAYHGHVGYLAVFDVEPSDVGHQTVGVVPPGRQRQLARVGAAVEEQRQCQPHVHRVVLADLGRQRKFELVTVYVIRVYGIYILMSSVSAA